MSADRRGGREAHPGCDCPQRSANKALGKFAIGEQPAGDGAGTHRFQGALDKWHARNFDLQRHPASECHFAAVAHKSEAGDIGDRVDAGAGRRNVGGSVVQSGH